MKAEHLETMGQRQVKIDFGHDLVKSYNHLPTDKKTLSPETLATLTSANIMYKDKGFEYFHVRDAVTGFSRIPDIAILETIALTFLHDAG